MCLGASGCDSAAQHKIMTLVLRTGIDSVFGDGGCNFTALFRIVTDDLQGFHVIVKHILSLAMYYTFSDRYH